MKSKLDQYFWFLSCGKTCLILRSFSGFYLSRKSRDMAFLVLLQQRADYRVVCTFLEKCEIKDSFYLCRRQRLRFRSPDFLRPEYVIQREHTTFALQTQLRRNGLNMHWSSVIQLLLLLMLLLLLLLLLFSSNFKLNRKCAQVSVEVPLHKAQKSVQWQTFVSLRTDRRI